MSILNEIQQSQIITTHFELGMSFTPMNTPSATQTDLTVSSLT